MAEITLGDSPTSFSAGATAQQVTVPANFPSDAIWLTVETADAGKVAWAREETEAHSLHATNRGQLPAGRWPITRPPSIAKGASWSVWVIIVSGTCTCYVEAAWRGQ